jgi:hypothetical protein
MTDVQIEAGERAERAEGGGRRNSHRKVKLISRDELDGRTSAAKHFDAVVLGIVADLGGEDRLSTMQKWLIESFAGVALIVADANARLLLGEEVDVLQHSTAISTMVRTAQRLGLQRSTKPVKDMETFLAERKAKAASNMDAA